MKKYINIGLFCFTAFAYAMEIPGENISPEKQLYAMMARLKAEQDKPGSKIITDENSQQERKIGRGFSDEDHSSMQKDKPKPTMLNKVNHADDSLYRLQREARKLEQRLRDNKVKVAQTSSKL